MRQYLIRRILLMIPTLLGVAARFGRSLRKGLGSIAVDGRMVDVANLKQVNKVLSALRRSPGGKKKRRRRWPPPVEFPKIVDEMC